MLWAALSRDSEGWIIDGLREAGTQKNPSLTLQSDKLESSSNEVRGEAVMSSKH